MPTAEELAAHYGDSLRQMTPAEFAEWQALKRRAHEMGVILPSDRPAFSPLCALLGGPLFWH